MADEKKRPVKQRPFRKGNGLCDVETGVEGRSHGILLNYHIISIVPCWFGQRRHRPCWEKGMDGHG